MTETINVPTNFQYLKPRQVLELETEAKAIDERLRSPVQHGADKGDMRRRRKQIQAMLDEQQSPDLNPQEKDAWAKEAKRLEERFAPGMLSAAVMRRNPPGAVDRHLRWHREFAKDVFRWKNIRRALFKGDDSPGVANIETLRPHSTPQDASSIGAQIEPKTFVGLDASPAYKEGWERTFGDDAAETSTAPRAKVQALCGKSIDPRGLKTHEKHCDDCSQAGGEG